MLRQTVVGACVATGAAAAVGGHDHLGFTSLPTSTPVPGGVNGRGCVWDGE